MRLALFVALALATQGCAITLTTAWGADASARLFAQPGSSCAPVGTQQTVVEAREGKLGPDNVTTTTTTAPAFAPLASSHGASVSETAGGLLGTVLGFLGRAVAWVFP